MQRSIENLGSRVTAIATDLESSITLASKFSAPLIPLWQASPTITKKLIGRFTGKSQSIWSAEPKRRLRKIIKKHPAEAILIHFLDVAVEFSDVILEQQTRTAVCCHGSDFDWGLHDDLGNSLRDAESYRSKCLTLAPKLHLVANSNYTRSRLIAGGFSPEQISINHFGIDLPPPSEQNRSNNTSGKILYLGRLVDFKGPTKLIEAFELASKTGLNAELIIAGDGPLRHSCESLASSMSCRKAITFLGTVDRNTGARLRQEVDIFTAHNCTASRSGRVETFGVSILEAMADGLPVVTGESGGITDMITNGENGLLFEPGDIHQHARLLCELSNNPTLRTQLGTNAKSTVTRKFSVKQEVEGLTRIVQNLKQ